MHMTVPGSLVRSSKEDAIISVEEGGVEVRESAVPGPSESRDESEIDRRRCVLLPD